MAIERRAQSDSVFVFLAIYWNKAGPVWVMNERTQRSLHQQSLFDPVNRLAIWQSTQPVPVRSIGDTQEKDSSQ